MGDSSVHVYQPGECLSHSLPQATFHSMLTEMQQNIVTEVRKILDSGSSLSNRVETFEGIVSEIQSVCNRTPSSDVQVTPVASGSSRITILLLHSR